MLLRAYGRDSDILIDREMEVTTHVLLAERGLASQLLARFQNGLLYQFLPGRACTADDIIQDPIWQAIAARLGEWHARLPMPILKAENTASREDEGRVDLEREIDQPSPRSRTIWTVMQEWLDALPAESEEQKLLQQRLLTAFDQSFEELNNGRSEDSSKVCNPFLRSGRTIDNLHSARTWTLRSPQRQRDRSRPGSFRCDG